jgi:hypothetical protein
LLSISAVLGGILLYTRDTGSELRKRLVERLVDR